MSGSQDIRQWAADNGIELNGRGRIPGAVREQYEAAHPNGSDDAGEMDEPLLIVPDGPAPGGLEMVPDGPQEEVRAGPKPERAPQPPRERKGILARKPKDGKTSAKRIPRTSVETLLGGVWSVLGSLAGRSNPQLVPMSRMMMFQSATVGIVGDEAIKGTAVDRLLQPLARAGEKGEIAAAIIGPPVIVAAVTARPELYPVAAPVLEMLVTTYLEICEPAMEKIAKRIERMESKLGGAQVKDLLASVFADVDVPTAPSADEEAAIRRAQEQ